MRVVFLAACLAATACSADVETGGATGGAAGMVGETGGAETSGGSSGDPGTVLMRGGSTSGGAASSGGSSSGGSPATGGATTTSSGGEAPSSGGMASGGAAGAAQGGGSSGGAVTSGGSSSGGSKASGGAAGAAGAGGASDPLAPFPAPYCAGFTALRSGGVGTCLLLRGRFELRSPFAEFCAVANPTTQTCAVFTDKGTARVDPTTQKAVPADYPIVYFKDAENAVSPTKVMRADVDAAGKCPYECAAP